MRIRKVNVKNNSLNLTAFGDLHLGHSNCDKNLIDNVIEYIKKTRCAWIGMGDVGDAIIPNDPRFDYRSIDNSMKTPQDQYQYAEELFEPIRQRCVGLLDGNHDINHWKRYAHNYVAELSRRLDIEYLTIDAYIRFHFEQLNCDFDVYAHHGWTGSRTKGGAITRIGDLSNIFPDANLYLMGHIHQLGLADERASLYVDGNLEIRDKIQYYGFTGSYLKGYVKNSVSYVEEKTYRPNLLGALTIQVTPQQTEHGITFCVEASKVT